MDDIHDLFKEMIATFLGNSLEGELDEKLGYTKYDYKNIAIDFYCDLPYLRRGVFFIKKIIILFLSITIILCSILSDSIAYTFWVKNYSNMDGRFETIYPEGFWDSTLGKATTYVGIPIVLGLFTYFTCGTGAVALANAGHITQWIGGTIGTSVLGYAGASGGTTMAGLAALGGGTIASGGFGVAGGVTVLSTISDISIAISLDTLTSSTEKNQEKKYIDTKGFTLPYLSLLKVPMIENHDLVDPQIGRLLDLLDEAKENNDFTQISRLIDMMHYTLNNLFRDSSTPTKTTAYDYLTLAIIEFNYQKYEASQKALNKSLSLFKSNESGVAEYVKALLSQSEGDDDGAIVILSGIIKQEKKALPPYIVLAQIYIDKGNTLKAIDILEKGLKYAKGGQRVLNQIMGDAYFSRGLYEKSIRHYKAALKNTTINEDEAKYKADIAVCYRRLHNTKKCISWFDDAKSEVDKNDESIKNLIIYYEQKYISSGR